MTWLVFIVAVLGAPTALFAQSPESCARPWRQLVFAFEEAPAKPVGPPEMYHYEEQAGGHEFWITGYLRGKELHLSLNTRAPDGTRAPTLRAAEHFPRILKHFEGHYEEIVGQWQWHSTDYASQAQSMDTNLKAFNDLSARMSREQAALQTWTGQQAARYGYPRVRFTRLDGRRPGRYTYVQVHFSKP